MDKKLAASIKSVLSERLFRKISISFFPSPLDSTLQKLAVQVTGWGERQFRGRRLARAVVQELGKMWESTHKIRPKTQSISDIIGQNHRTKQTFHVNEMVPKAGSKLEYVKPAQIDRKELRSYPAQAGEWREGGVRSPLPTLELSPKRLFLDVYLPPPWKSAKK